MKNIVQKTAGFAFAGLLFICIQSCTDGKGAVHGIPKTFEAIPVRVATAAPASSRSVIRVSGQITTENETVLGFKTGGIVRRMLVHEGDAVKKGQLLAVLDLTEIDASVAQARINAEKAQRDFARAKSLYADSVATLEQFQNAETNVAVAARQLQAAEFNRSYSQINATADGFVLKRFVNAGQVVSTGDPVLLVNVVNASGWLLTVGVSDRHWAQLTIGDECAIVIDAFPAHALTGKIIRKSETSDLSSGVFPIEIDIRSDGLKLATGMFGAAEFTSKSPTPGWSVPFSALLDADGHEGYVFVTDDGSTAHKQAVMIETFSGDHVIVSGGLKDGQQLITSGSAYLTDGSPIRIVK